MACSDVQTIQAGNGTKTQFSFDFPYIFKSEIHVYFWNAVTKEYDEKLTTDATYPWQITDANPTIVEFTGTAPPSPATPVDPGEPTVDNVKIRRITQVDDIRALFNPGSAIRSDDLNKNFEQLRYAIQEANCQGIPDDVDAYLKEYYWDRFDNTLYSADTWRSDDATIATTAALDQRFQDEVSETFTKSELAAASNQMPDNDTAVPTTGAVNDYINEVITNDIAGSDGVSITDDGDGTITIGLTDNTVDFDKIKDADQIKLADQVADPDAVGTDNNIFTAQAATRRFNNYYQNDVPPVTDGIGIGQVWVDPNDDLTLSVWSGSNWVGVTSGGTFTNQPKVIYVDATSGDDTNDGHRISRPKKTIKAALSDINSDSVYGDGSIISVAPGIYAETLPLDIQKNDVGIIGQSLRTCIIHPKIPQADHASYGVNTPHSQELQSMFRVNSGSYFTNLTLTGLKASGTRGASGSLYTDSTYGLPPNQGWNFSFYPNAVIKKSPYIQNCTNFSDSQINNVNFTPHTPGEGAAGDLDSAPTGGGILVDGSVPATSSPLRSMVCDSYTHTALDGPGLFVTNNGYTQCTSSYAFFNHAHITCINGGQANLAASTSDFGRFGLIADGKSTSAIFTSNVDGAAADNSKTFHINAPTAGSGWHGSATRPQDNMLVTVNSVTYPVLSAVARTDSEGGAGWTVTISRPDPSDTASNLGLNGAVSDNASVEFFLRSMIASSGHTMEYVGSGTDYTALPENGGVPIDANQVVERNNGKVWSAITDHKGKFSLGSFFTVDQQSKSIIVDPGSFQVDLSTLTVDAGGNAVFGAPLDMGNNQVTSTTGNLKLNASGNVDVQTNKIINLADPTAAQDAVTKNYTDNNFINDVVDDLSPQLGANLDVNGKEIISTGNGDITINPGGTGDIVLDANVLIDGSITADSTVTSGQINNSTNYTYLDNGVLQVNRTDNNAALYVAKNGTAAVTLLADGSASFANVNAEIDGTGQLTIKKATPYSDPSFRILNRASGNANAILMYGDGSASFANSNVNIDSSGRLLVGTTTEGYAAYADNLTIADSGDCGLTIRSGTLSQGNIYFSDGTSGTDEYEGIIQYLHNDDAMAFGVNNGSERMRIDSSGTLGVGCTPNGFQSGFTAVQIGGNLVLNVDSTGAGAGVYMSNNVYRDSGNSRWEYINTDEATQYLQFDGQHAWRYATSGSANTAITWLDAMRIDNSGNVGIGTTSPAANLEITPGTGAGTLLLNNASGSEADGALNIEVNSGGVLYESRKTGGLAHIWYATGAERMRLDSSGRLLVGTSSVIGAGNDLLVLKGTAATDASFYLGRNANASTISNGNGLGYIKFGGGDGGEAARIAGIADGTWSSTSDCPGRLVFSTTADGASSPTERMRINNKGETGVACDSTGWSFGVYQGGTAGTTNYLITGNYGSSTPLSGGTRSFGVFTNGNVVNTNDSYGAISDIKLKENIVDANSQWDDFKAVRFRKYNFKEETGHETFTQLGVIAQELEQVCPGLVDETPDRDEEGNDLGTTTKSVKYSILTKKALVALQEAMERIETLEQRLTDAGL